MTYPRARTDYGLVKVKVIKENNEDVKVKLMENCKPLGEKGEKSWIPKTVLIKGDN